jgi:hypothetical protein
MVMEGWLTVARVFQRRAWGMGRDLRGVRFIAGGGAN